MAYTAALNQRHKSLRYRQGDQAAQAPPGDPKMIEGCRASVHQVSIEQVNFHEVGAADSIADIVGACVALELLALDEIVCSALNVGSGTVETEHGRLPVHAPATVRNSPGQTNLYERTKPRIDYSYRRCVNLFSRVPIWIIAAHDGSAQWVWSGRPRFSGAR